MNRNLLFSLLVLLTPFFVSAQVDETKPFRVSKAVAFAETAPLRDLAAVLLPDKEDALFEKEVENELDYEKWTDEGMTTPNVQNTMGTKQSRGPLAGWDGQANTGYFPPDTDGDVSEEYFVQMVNSKYNVWDKNGVKLLGPLNLSTLWASLPGPWVGSNDGDPIVVYDEQAQRWVLTQFYVSSSTKYELFAVSQTADPTGAYYLYAFTFGTTMNDYPKVGVWGDGYYATYNMFQGNTFTGSRVTAVEREKMLIGDATAQMIEFHKSGYYSTMPADIDGENLAPEGEPCPVMYITPSKTIQIWGFHADWENTANSYLNLLTTLVPTTFSSSVSIVQPNGQNLDNLSGMIMNRLAYRKFEDHASMVTNHTVYANGKAGVRWYEIRKDDGGSWTLYQQGTYAPNADVHRWMGSIAMNANGDIGLGFSVTNNTDVHPSIRYTGRHDGDALGQMTIEEVELKTGTTSQANYSRWGDYACMNVDPANDTVFWFTTEYNGWRTYVASFDLGGIAGASCDAGADAYICTNDQFQTSGTGTGVLEMQWTTSGDGFFSPDDEFASTYIRGSQDVANHGCWLTLTVTGFDGNQVSDSMYLNIVPWVNAGNDTTIMNTDSYQLQAQGTESGTIAWTTSGDGSFSDAGIMQPIYTPGTQDVNNGLVTLTVQVSITDPCTSSKTDAMVLGFTGVGVEEINAAKLDIYPNPTNDIFTLTVDGITAGEEFTYFVYTSYGKEIYREVVNAKSSSYEKRIDLSDFKAGIYFVNIKTHNGTITKKVVKE